MISQTYPLLRIKPRSRLVHNKNFRIVQHGSRQQRPLAHSPGKRTQPFVHYLLQPHQFKQLPRLLPAPFPLHALKRTDVAHELRRREVLVNALELGREAHLFPICRPLGKYVAAAVNYLAACPLYVVGEQPQKGGFSCAVSPQQAVDTFVKGQGNAVKGGKAAVFFREIFYFKAHFPPPHFQPAALSSRECHPRAFPPCARHRKCRQAQIFPCRLKYPQWDSGRPGG